LKGISQCPKIFTRFNLPQLPAFIKTSINTSPIRLTTITGKHYAQNCPKAVFICIYSESIQRFVKPLPVRASLSIEKMPNVNQKPRRGFLSFVFIYGETFFAPTTAKVGEHQRNRSANGCLPYDFLIKNKN
jgi:hypothetical protein